MNFTGTRLNQKTFFVLLEKKCLPHFQKSFLSKKKFPDFPENFFPRGTFPEKFPPGIFGGPPGKFPEIPEIPGNPRKISGCF